MNANKLRSFSERQANQPFICPHEFHANTLVSTVNIHPKLELENRHIYTDDLIIP